MAEICFQNFNYQTDITMMPTYILFTNSLLTNKFSFNYKLCIFSSYQGPVVQSIVSLTKSLVNDSLSLLVRLKSSVLIFFAEKNGSVFMYNVFEILTSR